jgi:hypothetical protein
VPTEKARSYREARGDLISFLLDNGFRPHPREVFCPSPTHCWVDVAALKDSDYWAFEYKSRNDPIRRGLDQCRSYSRAFNYVVLVADRHRTTRSPYFGRFKRQGFGVWTHTANSFYPILKPRRQSVIRRAGSVVERQFKRLKRDEEAEGNRRISDWFV